MSEIKKIAVIGAGVMGAGIAAQAANAGVEVLLFDIVPKGEKEDRSTIAKSAIAKLLKTKPAPLMHKSFAKRITPCNLEDDLALLKECDWVIEAIIENLDIKRNLYGTVFKNAKRTALISSNTSTIPLADLTAELTAAQKKRFAITHFFNPPRYMRLLEIVESAETDKKLLKKVTEFTDVHMGKTNVPAKDTPGFIGNRIGIFWLHAAVIKAIEHGIDVESADAVLGRSFGFPRTGVFGLLDLVGLDLMPHILSSMQGSLKKKDPFNELGDAPEFLSEMIANGYTGRKGKGGFYRLNTEGGKKQKEALNLQTREYSKAVRPKPACLKMYKKGGLKGLMGHDSLEARYAWDVMSHTLAYAASLVPEIADDIAAVDEAMRLGFNWKYGPFELMDKIGTDWMHDMLVMEGRKVPKLIQHARDQKFYTVKSGRLHALNPTGKYDVVKRADGVLLLQDIKRQRRPILSNKSASLWDIGDGVVCLEYHSKMNSLNPLSLSMINKSIDYVEKNNLKGMVFHNEGSNFSVGANIVMLLVTSKLRLFPLIRWILAHGQNIFNRMKYAKFPVVGAPSGMALGGGCETLLHCNALTAHAETYMGLVEAGVGIVPGWGGCKEMLERHGAKKKAMNGPMPAAMESFMAIATAQVGTSAFECQKMEFLRAEDKVVMNKDRLLAEGKAKVLEMAEGYVAPEPPVFKLAGESGQVAMRMGVNDFAKKGMATPHDVVVAGELAKVLTGGKKDVLDEVSEAEVLKLERDAIVNLCKTKGTRDRILHMLKKGKPLRN